MHAALLQADISSAVDLQSSRPHRPGIDVLADRIALHIESLVPRGRAQCLDVGDGDTAIAEAARERLARTSWRCVDARPASRDANPDRRGRGSRAQDDDTLPFADGEFDVAVLSDVLHDDPPRAAQLLAEAARVARYVLVKDRFERHSCARIEEPLTRDAFIDLAKRQGLVITAFDSGLAFHQRSPVTKAPVQPGSNFVAVLCRGGGAQPV